MPSRTGCSLGARFHAPFWSRLPRSTSWFQLCCLCQSLCLEHRILFRMRLIVRSPLSTPTRMRLLNPRLSLRWRTPQIGGPLASCRYRVARPIHHLTLMKDSNGPKLLTERIAVSGISDRLLPDPASKVIGQGFVLRSRRRVLHRSPTKKGGECGVNGHF